MYSDIHNYIISAIIRLNDSNWGCFDMRKNKSYQPQLCCGNHIQTGMPSPYDVVQIVFHETNGFQFKFNDRAIQLSRYGTELNLQKNTES